MAAVEECVCPGTKCSVCIDQILDDIFRSLAVAPSSDEIYTVSGYPWDIGRRVRPVDPQKLQRTERCDGHYIRLTETKDSQMVEKHEVGQQTTLNFDEPTPELNAFLLQLEGRDEDDVSRDINYQILTDVRAMIQNVIGALEETYPEPFSGAVIHMVGSVGEKTKVGIYEEFDFMIELPVLQEWLEEEAHRFENGVDPFQESSNTHMPLPYDTRQNLLQEKLLQTLRPQWTVTKELTSCLKGSGVNTVLGLRYQPENGGSPVDVFCDIVFSTSFTWPPGLGERKYFVLKKDHCVQTNIFKEREKLDNSPMSESAKRVYRLAKMLTRDLLPSVFDSERCKFDAPVPSYWLKQIVLFMMDEFPTAEAWQEEYLGLRVSQFMSRLSICLAENTLFSYFSRSTNHLQNEMDGNYVVRDNIPEVAVLFEKASQGDPAAFKALSSLRSLTTELKTSLTTEARLTLLAYILFVHEKLSDLPAVKEYVDMNLIGVVELRQDQDKIKVLYDDEDATVEGFTSKYMKPGTFVGPTSGKMFPEEWRNRYALLRKCIPDGTLADLEKRPKKSKNDLMCEEISRVHREREERKERTTTGAIL